jgi:multidrug resistance efflux pump
MALVGKTSGEELASRRHKQSILRKKCEETRQNILEIKENTLKSRAKSGSSLREALQSSTMRANSLLAHEVQLKSLLKESTTVPPSASCSTLYAIPEDVAERLKKAKNLSEHESAQKEAKDAYNFAATERMKLYVLNKQEAVLKSVMKGYFNTFFLCLLYYNSFISHIFYIYLLHT